MTDLALIERITRSLAFMLRHQPEKFDLDLDPQGFAELEDVVHALNERLGEAITEADVREAVLSGDRVRYEIQDQRIRALYGHSIPVEPGPSSKPPEVLFVAIPEQDVERAQRYGLRGGRRRFLHLALTKEDACDSGRRTSRHYTVLRIRALDAWEEGIAFYDRKALWLAEEVPTHLIEVEGTYHDGTDPVMAEGGRFQGRSQDRGRERDSRPSRRGGRGRGRDRGRGGFSGEREQGRERPAFDAPGMRGREERDSTRAALPREEHSELDHSPVSHGEHDDRPPRPYGEQGDRSERPHGEQGGQSERSYGERGERTERPSGEREDRPARSHGGRDDRPERPHSGREERSERPFGERGDRSESPPQRPREERRERRPDRHGAGHADRPAEQRSSARPERSFAHERESAPPPPPPPPPPPRSSTPARSAEPSSPFGAGLDGSGADRARPVQAEPARREEPRRPAREEPPSESRSGPDTGGFGAGL